MTSIHRPQPVGAFPLPAGLLLIAGEGSEPVRQSLLEGRRPTEWPTALEGQRLAYNGEVERAIEVFSEKDDPVSRYNLFVLDPERVGRKEVVAALGEQWRPLVDTVAFTLGLTSVPPAVPETADELAAIAWTARAASALDNGDEDEAIDALRNAAHAAEPFPALAGVVLSELAGRAHLIDAAEHAVRLLTGTDLNAALAEALYQRAGLIHGLAIEGRAVLQEAISGYTAALALLTERDDAPLFARVHMNLGIALLAQPLLSAGDGLRAGVAVQSLRTAARLLDEQTDAEEWASAHLNLANALVYAPSAHQRDNLMEAVDLYERIIRVRTPRKDPLGRARVLANQGNALAHLGLHADAQRRYTEAEMLFATTGDEASADRVREMLRDLIDTIKSPAMAAGAGQETP